MRFVGLLAAGLALALSACASSATTALQPADAATTLIAGGRITMTRWSSPPIEGHDPLALVTFVHEDGREMHFEEANHAPYDVMAQAPGGPLAQIMGLFGDEQPTLLSARANENLGAPFICAPDGPAVVGVYEDAYGTVRIIGLKERFQFEERPGAAPEAVPYSPDHICARLLYVRL